MIPCVMLRGCVRMCAQVLIDEQDYPGIENAEAGRKDDLNA
jgi:hypothetical protein